MSDLYHGTLARNIGPIKTRGLFPHTGLWTANFHSEAEALVYAVGEEHRGKLAAILSGQMVKGGLVERSDDYQFTDFKNDLIEHCAVIVVRSAKFSCYPNRFESGHPLGSEPGDWYSRKPISADQIQNIMIGQEMFDWLKPSEQDFTYRLSGLFRELGVPKAKPRMDFQR